MYSVSLPGPRQGRGAQAESRWAERWWAGRERVCKVGGALTGGEGAGAAGRLPRTCCSRPRMTCTACCRMSSLVCALSDLRCSWHMRPQLPGRPLANVPHAHRPARYWPCASPGPQVFLLQGQHLSVLLSHSTGGLISPGRGQGEGNLLAVWAHALGKLQGRPVPGCRQGLNPHPRVDGAGAQSCPLPAPVPRMAQEAEEAP